MEIGFIVIRKYYMCVPAILLLRVYNVVCLRCLDANDLATMQSTNGGTDM